MSAEQLIADLDALYSKYKMMENSLMQKTQRFSGQVVEIKSTLGILRHIAKTDDADAGATALETDFRLGDALFVKAKVPKTDKVCLWLGVSVGRRRFGCFAVAFLPCAPPLSMSFLGGLSCVGVAPSTARHRPAGLTAVHARRGLRRSQANVMLEYDTEEALALLEKNFNAARVFLAWA